MGRSGVLFSMIAMAMLAVAGMGCQQSGPLRLSVVADAPGSARFEETKDSPYVNAGWLDDDSAKGPVGAALSMTGAAAGAMVGPFVELTTAGVRWFYNDKPSVADKMLEDPNNADNRREGINKLANFGLLKNPVFEKRCREISQLDTDYTVRATAIRTSNRARDAKATPLFIKGLNDSNDWVRMESAKALANIPDVGATESLIAMLNNPAENRDIRVAAADALKHYRTLPAARALSSVLSDKYFVIAWQARRSLRYMTDRDYGYDTGAWLAYFTGTDKPG